MTKILLYPIINACNIKYNFSEYRKINNIIFLFLKFTKKKKNYFEIFEQRQYIKNLYKKTAINLKRLNSILNTQEKNI